MKSGLKQLIEWLDKRAQHVSSIRRDDLRHIRAKARALLAEEEAATLDKGKDELREALENMYRRAISGSGITGGGNPHPCRHCLEGLVKLSRSPKPVSEEPLKELAKRKGVVSFERVHGYIAVDANKRVRYFESDASVRAYINTLPDHDGKGEGV